MNKAILLDGSFAAVPLFKELEKRFSEVYILSGRRNDILNSYSNNYVNIDYSNVEGVKSFAEEMKTNFIFPGCNDVSYYTASQSGSSVTVSADAFDLINNKLKFRTLLKELGLRAPQIYNSEEPKMFSYPCLLKRQVSYSGLGISKILSEHELNCVDYDREEDLFEEYISGQLKSASCILYKGKIKSTYFVREFGDNSEFRVDRSYVELNADPTEVADVRGIVEQITRELKIKRGLFHLQYIVDDLGDIYPIEATLRFPGDLYGLLIQKSLGTSYFGAILDAMLDKPTEETGHFRKKVERRTIFFDSSVDLDFHKSSNQFYPSYIGDKEPSIGDRIGVYFEEKTNR